MPVRKGITIKTPSGKPRNNTYKKFTPIKTIHQCKTSEGAYREGIPIGNPTSAPRKNPIKIFNQAKIQQLHQEKGKHPKMKIGKIKADTTEEQTHVIPEVEKTSKCEIRVEITSTHKYNTRSRTKKANHTTTFKNAHKMFQVNVMEKIIIHLGTNYFTCIEPQKLKNHSGTNRKTHQLQKYMKIIGIKRPSQDR